MKLVKNVSETALALFIALNPTKKINSLDDIPQAKQYESIKQKSIGIKNKHMQGRHMKVGATAYYGDPLTYIGTVPQVGKTIAVDPKVIPFGTRVYIPQFNKVFIAEDCGSAIKGNRIDIFMNTYDECMQWGFRDIDIYILDE